MTPRLAEVKRIDRPALGGALDRLTPWFMTSSTCGDAIPGCSRRRETGTLNFSLNDANLLAINNLAKS